MLRSTSSQEDESVFLEEGFSRKHHETNPISSLSLDDEATFSITTNQADTTTGKMDSFFAENYDHENVTINTTINEEILSSKEQKRRKSVSAHFRSISKDTT